MVSDGAAQVENNASFQMMLNKQVQAKHALAREVENRQSQTKQAQKTTGKESSSTTTQPENVDATTTQKSVQKVNHLQLAMMATSRAKAQKDAESIDPMQLDSKDLMALDAKSTLVKRVMRLKLTVTSQLRQMLI